MNLEKIIGSIEPYAYEENHKSAFEVFKILDDHKKSALKEIAESNWFKHNFTQLENLVYSDESTWNTDYFKKEYTKIIPKILYHLKQER